MLVQTQDWNSSLFDGKNVSQPFDIFYDNMQNLIELFFCTIYYNYNVKNNCKSKPQISAGLVSWIRTREKIYNKLLNNHLLFNS